MEKVYKIEPDALKDVKKVLEAEDIIGEGETQINQWKRQGYNLRDAKSLGFDDEGSYLHVNANEEFFNKNKGDIDIDGVEELTADKKKQVIKAIKEEQEKAQQGMGTIFG